jgi:ribonucleoside-diphosphate reductase alpha chain
MLAGNVSSGMEPIYALRGVRSVRDTMQHRREIAVEDFAFRRWRDTCITGAAPPGEFVTADTLSADAHLAMQATLQPCVDNAISKTITLAPTANSGTVDDVFRSAHATGIKGCTVFRPGSMRGQVIRTRDESHCCGVERECD